MKLEDLEIGRRYSYYPPPQDQCQLPHFPAVVEAIGKRVKVKVFTEGAEQGIEKWVSAKRLNIQMDLQI